MPVTQLQDQSITTKTREMDSDFISVSGLGYHCVAQKSSGEQQTAVLLITINYEVVMLVFYLSLMLKVYSTCEDSCV